MSVQVMNRVHQVMNKIKSNVGEHAAEREHAADEPLKDLRADVRVHRRQRVVEKDELRIALVHRACQIHPQLLAPAQVHAPISDLCRIGGGHGGTRAHIKPTRVSIGNISLMVRPRTSSVVAQRHISEEEDDAE